MKNALKRAASLVMTTVLLAIALLPAGCSRKAKDEEQIKETVQDFFETFAAGNSDDIDDLISGDFTYSYIRDKEKMEIMLKIASKTEIESFKSIEISDDHHSAKAKMRISYIDIGDLTKYFDYHYMTKEEWLVAIDEYDELKTCNMTFSLVNSDGKKWRIKDRSIERYQDMMDDIYWINITKVSDDDAMKAFNDLIPGFAKGELEQEYYTLALDSVMIFNEGYSDDPVIRDAAMEFCKSYYQYIVDHGIEIEKNVYFTHSAVLSGYAPSREEILDYFSSDEFAIEWYMASIRADNDPNPYEEGGLWAQYYAGIYLDLAKRIPLMESDEYQLDLSIEPGMENPKIYTEWYIFPLTPDDVYVATRITDEQADRCLQKAAESLYLAGEITEAQYKSYIQASENNDNSRSNEYDGDGNTVTDRNVNWHGTPEHENQAVNVFEYIPDWSDGTLIYGGSDIDSNGIYMHYTKEPGWLDTAGYCVGPDGITVMVRYDHVFEKGTELVYDWYIDGEQYGDSVSFVVSADGSTEFEFTLPDTQISNYGTCELRLWESGHSHVIAYVQLTKT